MLIVSRSVFTVMTVTFMFSEDAKCVSTPSRVNTSTSTVVSRAIICAVSGICSGTVVFFAGRCLVVMISCISRSCLEEDACVFSERTARVSCSVTFIPVEKSFLFASSFLFQALLLFFSLRFFFLSLFFFQ